VVLVGGNGTTDILVAVTRRENHLPESRIAAGNGQESGSIASFYSSNPEEVLTAVKLFRRDGEKTTDIDLSVARGYAFSTSNVRTAVPSGSLTLTSPSSRITLGDARSEQSPLTVQSATIRGLHFDNQRWLFDAGVSSPTNFQAGVTDTDVDTSVAMSRRFRMGRFGTLTPGIQHISAATRYVSGQSGTLGSLEYAFVRSTALQFRTQIASAASGVANYTSLDLTRSSDSLRAELRAIPFSFPSLSSTASRGVQFNGSWDHRLSDRVGFELFGTRDMYLLLDRTDLTNATWGGRLEYRPLRAWMLSAGYSGAHLGRTNAAAVGSNSIPLGVSFDSHRFGNSFQYQFRTNSSNERGSHSFRDSIRVSVGHIAVTAFAARQTQAPTVDFVLANLPALRDAMLAEGLFATTPEQISQFIAAHAGLIATGQLRDLTINLAPVRDQLGAAFSWTGLHNRLSTRVESRWDKDRGLRQSTTLMSHDARFTVRLTPQTEIIASGTVYDSKVQSLGTVRTPSVSIGVRRLLNNVPDFIRPSHTGTIHGLVYADQGKSASSGIAGVTVILDGSRHTTTNKRGEYTFSSVHVGHHSVELKYPTSDSEEFTTSPYVETSETAEVNFGIGERKAALFGSVRSDAMTPLAGVAIVVSGPVERRALTDTSGNFSLVDLAPGNYTIGIDEQSIPASHMVSDIARKEISARLSRPAQADFVIRALRGISGQVVCAGVPVQSGTIELKSGEGSAAVSAHKVALAAEGVFAFGDLSAGTYELIASNGAYERRRTIQVPAEPTVIHGLLVDVCVGQQ
jgi:hypothetical protein